MRLPVYTLLILCLLLAPTFQGHAQGLADLTPQQRNDIDRVNTYLNRLDKVQAGFLQISPDGAISRGNFYLSRPGRLRFEYLPPDDLLIVADGTWVAVRENDLGTVDRFPIGETPLSLLLDKHVDIGTNTEIIALKREAGILRITLRDPDEPHKGEITLTFADDRRPDTELTGQELELRQWVIVDAQGLTTQIGLSEVREGGDFDPRLFIMRDAVPKPLQKR